MKKLLVVIVFILLISLFSGCVHFDDSKVIATTREFIKDYIPNPETIQFNKEIMKDAYNLGLDIYGSGTVLYEGTRQPFSYWIYINSEYRCVLKQLIIGEV